MLLVHAYSMVPSRKLKVIYFFFHYQLLTNQYLVLVYHSLPLLFTLYRSSLSQHSTSLFPLPIRSSFPTASAARSALEIHSLQKLRALAAGWTKGISTLLGWSDSTFDNIAPTSIALWKILQEIEATDLFRTGPNSGWELLLESTMEGALIRLTPNTLLQDREALFGLIATLLRLNFDAVESFLPSLLLTLASTPSSSSSSTHSKSPSNLYSLLNALLVHHTRSLLLPSLLNLLSVALSNESKVVNSLLDLEGSWKEGLSRSITGLGSRMAGDCAESLITGLKAALAKGEENGIGEREVKRRKKDVGKVVPVNKSNTSAIGRIQILHLFLRHIPSPLPLTLFNSIQSTIISPFLASTSEDLALTRGILGLRYATFERMAEEGVVENQASEGEEVVEKMLSLVKAGESEVVLEAVSSLLFLCMYLL